MNTNTSLREYGQDEILNKLWRTERKHVDFQKGIMGNYDHMTHYNTLKWPKRSPTLFYKYDCSEELCGLFSLLFNINKNKFLPDIRIFSGIIVYFSDIILVAFKNLSYEEDDNFYLTYDICEIIREKEKRNKEYSLGNLNEDNYLSKKKSCILI